jgi:hypothetical protein
MEYRPGKLFSELGQQWLALLAYLVASLLYVTVLISMPTRYSDEMLVVLMVPPIWAAQHFSTRIYLLFNLACVLVSGSALVFYLKQGEALQYSLNTFTALTFCLMVIGEILFRSSAARRKAETEREKLIAELQTALSNLKTLRGMLPICSYCKKIRDDRGYWNQVENYIKQHSEAEFTHGICPECIQKHFSDMD